jgi:hypothetical protein
MFSTYKINILGILDAVLDQAVYKLWLPVYDACLTKEVSYGLKYSALFTF